MKKTLSEIAKLVDGTVFGNSEVEIEGVSGIKEAQQGDITFLSNGKYRKELHRTNASAVVVKEDVSDEDTPPLIMVEKPDLAFARIAELFMDQSIHRGQQSGIHETATVGEDVQVEDDVWIGPHVDIAEGATIGQGSVIRSGSYIGKDTEIGKQCLIFPNVTILHDCALGDQVEIQSGAVIGSEGFGYAQVDGNHEKIPQLGTVVIEDDVHIGAGTTIDRARFDETRIGRGTKIDNLVQIAHNVEIGECVVLAAQSGIAGSTRIEKHAMFGGRAGVADHLHIEEGVKVGAGSKITKDVSQGQVVDGRPARPLKETYRQKALVKKLPEFREKVNDLKQEIDNLKDMVKTDGEAENN